LAVTYRSKLVRSLNPIQTFVMGKDKSRLFTPAGPQVAALQPFPSFRSSPYCLGLGYGAKPRKLAVLVSSKRDESFTPQM